MSNEAMLRYSNGMDQEEAPEGSESEDLRKHKCPGV